VKRSILAGATLMLLSSSSQSAEFKWWKIDTDVYGMKLIGKIEDGDAKKFFESLGDLAKKNYPNEKWNKPLSSKFALTVHLDSPGGAVKEAIQIGEFIRKEKFNTFVNEQVVCASACGLIWLAGNKRYAHVVAHIGFHAVFDGNDKDKKTSSSGNAIVGAYLGSLGFNYNAIAYLTMAPTDKMEWLSANIAKNYGINSLSCDKSRCWDSATGPF